MATLRTFTSSVLPARERGLEFGAAHAPGVRRTAAVYADLFARRGAPGFDARAWAGRFREVIGDVDPEAQTEIAGIAEGAGVDELDVVAVNARTEILAKADPRGERECSTVLVTPPGGPAYAVQTWDWYADMAGNWLKWRIPQPEGGWLETVTEYGLLAKIGVSSRGVGVMLNILHHESDDNDDVALPVHLVSRRILAAARSCDEALAMCYDTHVAASTALTVFDPDGGASMELFPDGPGVLGPTDRLLVRTNHFVSEEGRAGCLTYTHYPSTRIRFDWLDRVLRREGPTSALDVVKAMDHHDPAGGVCRHPEAELPAWQRTATLATVVAEPGVPRLQARAGGPCGHAGGHPWPS
ncbi:MAG: C45 family peptidase [Actinomycetota bacterium]|nr:C45 family peptidase [Actinomycetota bacterium]